MIKQKSDWARSSVAVTIVVAILIAGLTLYTFTLAQVSFLGWIMVGLLVAMVISGLFFMPLSVSLDTEALTVNFPLRRRRFPLTDIALAEPYSLGLNMIRLWGSGAWMGWWGWFSNRELGRFMLYASHLDHVIYIRLRSNRRQYLISCADPTALAAAINRR